MLSFFDFPQLPEKLNEIDDKGDLPLDLSLIRKLEGISDTLLQHRVDVNRSDRSGRCLLHKAIQRGTFDDFTSMISHALKTILK